jgi:hypothetical protein
MTRAIGLVVARVFEAQVSRLLGRTAISIQLAALGERFHVLQRLHEPGAPSFFRAPRTMTIFRRIDRRRGTTVILAHSLS